MIRLLLFALGLGDLVSVVHYLTHHRSGLTAALAALAVWAGAHSHIPALAPNPGRRVARGAARKAVRQAAKARRAAAA